MKTLVQHATQTAAVQHMTPLGRKCMHMCCGRPPEQCTHAPRAARSISGALWHDGALFAVGDRIAAECSRAASEHVRGTTLAARCAQPHHLASVDGRGPGARNSGSKSSTGARERRPSSCRACWTATEKKKNVGRNVLTCATPPAYTHPRMSSRESPSGGS